MLAVPAPCAESKGIFRVTKGRYLHVKAANPDYPRKGFRKVNASCPSEAIGQTRQYADGAWDHAFVVLYVICCGTFELRFLPEAEEKHYKVDETKFDLIGFYALTDDVLTLLIAPHVGS